MIHLRLHPDDDPDWAGFAGDVFVLVALVACIVDLVYLLATG